MNDIWAIVLAAGLSTRMGTQKLLLPFDGKTIIEKVVENILSSGMLLIHSAFIDFPDVYHLFYRGSLK